ncbi:hypothetical protein E2C01_068028 [Portunus trituberculatus]|uniref:Uncharacterized protein n=1 Tax=Portunus trituberculatus TaxID=210409 RepID=A0A5B7HQX5_PORTR|nr:hypothetical protein [Portunus trituberculatus]
MNNPRQHFKPARHSIHQDGLLANQPALPIRNELRACTDRSSDRTETTRHTGTARTQTRSCYIMYTYLLLGVQELTHLTDSPI